MITNPSTKLVELNSDLAFLHEIPLQIPTKEISI